MGDHHSLLVDPGADLTVSLDSPGARILTAHLDGQPLVIGSGNRVSFTTGSGSQSLRFALDAGAAGGPVAVNACYCNTGAPIFSSSIATREFTIMLAAPGSARSATR
jgi:hypothetical protein